MEVAQQAYITLEFIHKHKILTSLVMKSIVEEKLLHLFHNNHISKDNHPYKDNTYLNKCTYLGSSLNIFNDEKYTYINTYNILWFKLSKNIIFRDKHETVVAFIGIPEIQIRKETLKAFVCIEYTTLSSNKLYGIIEEYLKVDMINNSINPILKNQYITWSSLIYNNLKMPHINHHLNDTGMACIILKFLEDNKFTGASDIKEYIIKHILTIPEKSLNNIIDDITDIYPDISGEKIRNLEYIGNVKSLFSDNYVRFEYLFKQRFDVFDVYLNIVILYSIEETCTLKLSNYRINGILKVVRTQLVELDTFVNKYTEVLKSFKYFPLKSYSIVDQIEIFNHLGNTPVCNLLIR